MAMKFLSSDAVGGETFVTLPNGARPYDYEVHSVYIEYIAVGSPGQSRMIRMFVETQDGLTVAITGGDSQPGNTTRHYMAFPTAVLERVTAGDDIQWLPWPPRPCFATGVRIRAKNMGAAAPNDLIRMRVQYENLLMHRSVHSVIGGQSG